VLKALYGNIPTGDWRHLWKQTISYNDGGKVHRLGDHKWIAKASQWGVEIEMQIKILNTDQTTRSVLKLHFLFDKEEKPLTGFWAGTDPYEWRLLQNGDIVGTVPGSEASKWGEPATRPVPKVE